MLNECYKDATSNIQKCDREQQILIKTQCTISLFQDFARANAAASAMNSSLGR